MVFQLTFGGKLTNAEMKNAASKIKIEKKVLIIEERFEKFVWWRADEHNTATNTSRLTLDWAFFRFFHMSSFQNEVQVKQDTNSVWNPTEKTIFPLGFDALLPSAEFQT